MRRMPPIALALALSLALWAISGLIAYGIVRAVRAW